MVVFLTFSGNFMYFMGYSKWLLVASRLVTGLTHAHKHAAADQDFARRNRWNTVDLSGVGAGAGSSIFAFLTRCTRPEERAGIFAAIMACRQAGLLVGESPPIPDAFGTWTFSC